MPYAGSAARGRARGDVLAERVNAAADLLDEGLRRPHALIEQVGGCVDPLGEHVTTSATTSSRPGVRHVVKILPIMSCLLADTPRPLEPSVTQRDVEAEVANCVGGVVSPVLANLFMHYAFDTWMDREHPGVTFCRYVDDVVVHAVTLRQAERLRSAIAERMAEVG